MLLTDCWLVGGVDGALGLPEADEDPVRAPMPGMRSELRNPEDLRRDSFSFLVAGLL